MAPEIAKEKLDEDGRLIIPYTNAVDIWAMGKVLLTLLDGHRKSSRYGGRKRPLNQDEVLADILVSQMMLTDAEHRPTAKECLNSRWLRQEESFSQTVGQKRKASPDPINHRAQGPGPGTSQGAGSSLKRLT